MQATPLTPHGQAIAAGDGTLHGAIDYWQEQATQLRGEANVLADILRDAAKVIKTIEGESSEEEESLWKLRYMIDMALGPYDAELLKRK